MTIRIHEKTQYVHANCVLAPDNSALVTLADGAAKVCARVQ